MTKTELVLPYYIESWEDQKTLFYQKLKSMYLQFKEENRNILVKYPNITSLYFSIKILNVSYKWESEKRILEIIGEIISYPSIRHKIPFIIRGKEGETLDFDEASIESVSFDNKINDKENTTNTDSHYVLNDDERIIAKSASGNLLLTRDKDSLFIRNIKEQSRDAILKDSFDLSYYINAFFIGDGKDVVLQISKTEGLLLGIEDYELAKFEVDGFTVARNEGFNGYKPEISILEGRIPVWRDPITLRRVKESEMSKYIFLSPDGQYCAENQKRTIYYNRLTKEEIGEKDYNNLCQMYNWNTLSSEDEKKKKSILRNQLYKQYDADLLFEHVFKYYETLIGGEKKNEEPSTQQRMRIEQLCKNEINNYLNTKNNFTELFVDILGYVCFKENATGKEQRILIGESVWFLNYVSFSYDSHFLAFGAKMKENRWRSSEEGVFVLYDIKDNKVIVRQDGVDLHAVWMAMFNKKGDVAYYDSHANTYVAYAEKDYQYTNIAFGKSLLCFSPSGRYIALSDQNYIDYTHHPSSDWGHQPSGNVFIYETDNLEKCIEQFNDLGDGIDGTTRTTRRAKNVASAAFSSDEKRMLVVGEDGVVVIRNLHMNFSQERT